MRLEEHPWDKELASLAYVGADKIGDGAASMEEFSRHLCTLVERAACVDGVNEGDAAQMSRYIRAFMAATFYRARVGGATARGGAEIVVGAMTCLLGLASLASGLEVDVSTELVDDDHGD